MSITTLSTGPGRLLRDALLLALTLSFTACAWSNKEKGAAAGAATGAVVGGVIGNQTGSTARGAIIGAAVGGTAGALIGHRMDQQAKELEYLIPGAVVTRIGEGIVVTFDSGLLYDFDSSVIRPDAGQNLRQLAVSLDKYSDTNLLIVGHTDSVGNDQYNQDLSVRRARAAFQYLAVEGVQTGRMTTAGRGEMEPIASNDTDAGRQLNRRVEVAIYADATARQH
jgi:outer membrane protein OmpA-like peptidoglycan-associated protein